MKTYENYYFKATHKEATVYMSGLPLPDPAQGPYIFKNCSFHAGLKEVIKKDYVTSIFIN